MPDHPIFGKIIGRHAPDTQRILIYKEQIEDLLWRLTGEYNLITFDMRWRNSSKKLKWLTFKKFITLVGGYWLLEKDEIQYIYNGILYYGKICLAYMTCSVNAQKLFEI